YKGAVYTYNTSGAGNLQNGLNFTADDGQHWTHAKLQGLEGKVSAIAVSSYEDDFVAVGTNDGVYFSDDHGDTIKYELSNVFQNVTALAFDAYNPDQLYVATGGEQSTVYFVGNYNQISTSIKGGFQHYPMLFSLPKGDEITCLAYSPKLDRIAVATKKSEVYEYDKRSRKVTKLTETGIATIEK
ncbi:MAG: WD40/YVTN/BNR-like repeat-containing protein, partial [Tumebacillaceae bacterium]